MNAITPNDFLATTALSSEHQHRDGVELLYTPAESIFSASAKDMWKNGWSVMPQTMDRRPGSVYGKMIDWTKEFHLADARVDEKILETWRSHCATLNVACAFGPASSRTFAVDIDVLDENISHEIEELAVQMLGYTPLIRIGKAPKIALIYRHAPDDVIPSSAQWIADDKGNPSEHGVEVQGAGKLLTFAGRHHETGAYFKWTDKNPMVVGPNAAPLVTSHAVAQFIGAVDMLYAFADKPSSGGKRSASDTVQQDVGGSDKATDGRKNNLFYLVNTKVTSFDPAFWSAVDGGDQTYIAYRDAKLVEICNAFAAKNELSGWCAPHLTHGEALDKLDAWMAKLAKGKRPDPKKMRAPKAEGEGNARRAAPVPNNNLPTIEVEAGEIKAIVDQAEAALIGAELGVYQRSGSLVILGDAPVMTAHNREIVSRRVFEVGTHALVEYLAQSANWRRYDARSEGLVRTDPPMRVAQTLMERVGRWKLPVLAGSSSAPTMRPDGSLLLTEGYDERTGLVVDFGDVTFPEVPNAPTHDQAKDSMGVLRSIIDTFPFVDDASRSVALSAMLTAVVRRTLRTAPLHGFSAPVPGSGKSTLVDIAAILATGREAGVIAQGSDDAET